MAKNVIIIGAGGHAKVIANIIGESKDNLVGFLDDNKEIQNKEIYSERKVIGTLEDVNKFKDNYFIIGIGNNKIREEIVNKYNIKWYTAIHPNAIIAPDVKIEEGTVIMPGVIINPGTTIGKHCILNTACSVDHDNVIENYVHISPGSHLAGTVKIGKNTHIGIGTSVINNIEICKNCIIGASAMVNKNITEPGTYVGVPARLLKK